MTTEDRVDEVMQEWLDRQHNPRLPMDWPQFGWIVREAASRLPRPDVNPILHPRDYLREVLPISNHFINCFRWITELVLMLESPFLCSLVAA